MTGEARPRMLILAGPNGAGMTTFSRTLPEGEDRSFCVSECGYRSYRACRRPTNSAEN